MTMDARVKALLSEGYGAEDIALLLDCARELVDRAISRLRASGELAEIYRTDNA